MKHSRFLTTSLLLSLLSAPLARATVQTILNFGDGWKFFQPMSDDPSVDEATIPNAGGGAAPNNGPDLFYANFNGTTSAAGAWFAKQSDFTGPSGYATLFGKGFSLDGVFTGDPLNYSSYDGGEDDGPFGYGGIDYFTSPGAELTAFGKTLTIPTTGLRFASYYRTTFTLAADHTAPVLRMLLDDNALIYLDGVLVVHANRNDNTTGTGYKDAANSDTVATLNESGASANNEIVIQRVQLRSAGAATQADATVLVAVPRLLAGEHTLAIMVRNSGAASSDKCLAVQLLADDAGISPAVTNVQRQPNGPGFADDTFSFDVVVSKVNIPTAVAWTSNNPIANGPITGDYTSTYSYSYPAQPSIGTLGSATITFTDTINTLVSASITVTAPEAALGAELVLSPATPSYTAGFEQAALGGSSFSRRTIHTEMGFTSNGIVVDDITNDPVNGSKMLGFVNVNAQMTTEAVRLDPAVKGIKAGVTLRSFTTSATGFEAEDSFRVSVEGSADGTTWMDLGSVLPTVRGAEAVPVAPYLTDYILTKFGPGIPNTPSGIQPYISLSRDFIGIPAGVQFARVRAYQPNNVAFSGSENIRIDKVNLEVGGDATADTDGDGISNGTESTQGSNPANMLSVYRPVGTWSPGIAPGSILLTYGNYSAGDNHTYRMQASDDLSVWTDVTFRYHTGADAPQVNSSESTGSRRYHRLVAE